MELAGGLYVELAEAAQIERQISTLTPREAIGLIGVLTDPAYPGNEFISGEVRVWAIDMLRRRAARAERAAPLLTAR